MLTNNNTPIEKRVDLCLSEMNMWRTLIRVDSINYSNNKIGLIIPGWNTKKVLYFDVKKIPGSLLEEIKGGMNPHYRFHAYANIGVKKVEDIYIMFEGNF